uniref:NADH dehydrogenase subunit 6 n=1 Tax=Callimerus chinensis TaxID=3028307 RepID=UPI0023D7CE6E|nr:NADH dehydrogenase subunit 6 [Callimerus chinensis]WDE20710.1 NADH dehydrogenase subunit 6 [Callimerus chinensis]
MKFLLLISMFLSISILFVSHPMSLGFILLMQTMITSFIVNFLNFNFWYSYILFLIMIGGMLILFIYMTSIASNEKFLFSNKLVLLFIISMLFLMMMFFIDSFFSYNILNNFETYKLNLPLNFSFSMNKFFNFPNFLIFYISILYLLITLIAVVKISNLNLGPLRPKN